MIETNHEIERIKAETRMSFYYAMQEIVAPCDINPLIIIRDRYSIDYFVFNVRAEDLPPINKDVLSRTEYLNQSKDIYGRGQTIPDAIDDFIAKHQARRNVLIESIKRYYPKINPTNADDTEA